MKLLRSFLPSLVAVAILFAFASLARSATTVSGTLSASGSLQMLAPATYVPGVPILVRVDLKDSAGNLDRAAWNRTVNLTATGGVILNPTTVTLANGMGSALVTIGSSGGTTTTQLVAPGGTLAAPLPSPAQWRFLDAGNAPAATWKSDAAFDETGWSGPSVPQFGANDDDERTPVLNASNAAGSRKTWYFRRVINVPNPGAFTDLTLRLLYDDGIIVWINGMNVKQLNVTDPVGHTTAADSNRSAPAEATFETFTLPASALQAGDNLIAVEVHNAANSADLSFDFELLGNSTLPVGDPGNFSLTATLGSLTATKALTSLGTSPAMTNVSGTLAGSTTWNGVIHVTGDVTVPAGATLTIAPGTHVLVDGDATVGAHGGRRITVNGALNANGTLALPVSMTATSPSQRWGQLILSNAQPSTLNYTLIFHLGRGPNSSGHTGRCAMISLNTSALTLNDSVLGDGPGKALLSSGNCSLTLQRSLINRTVTGPELNNNCALLCEDSNIQFILPDYREDDPGTGGNERVPDDEDCLYVHNGAARSVIVRRSVFARCGDDVFDCLGGPITVEDSILREGWDKGLSLLNNNLTISRTQIVDCDKGIAFKNSSLGATWNTSVTKCTIVSEEHDTNAAPWGYSIPPSQGDPDTLATALWTQWKPPGAGGTPTQDGTMIMTVSNSILSAKIPIQVDNGPGQYTNATTNATYTTTFDTDQPANPAWPGPGNINSNPQFVNLTGKDFHLTAASPARDTGDPASPLDADGSRADMGALPFSNAVPNEVRWTLAGSPYHVIANATAPAGVTLRIDPGVAVQFNQNVQLIVRGRLLAEGTAGARIVFSHVPGAIAAGDADPIKLGVQTGPPKWAGVRIYDSMAQENVVRYCDFINAQGVSLSGSENYGSLGFIRSWGLVEFSSWTGTHLRMCYGRNPKLTVRRCIFPDMFVFDPVLGREENPDDFVAAANNSQEHLKVEFPTGDPELAGNPNFVDGQPVGGWWRVYFNDFYANKGHNDVFDGDSGRWDRPGQLVLDCRYNYFHGLSGDEHIDLGGDAYVASNTFERGHKDEWGTDFRYSNAISSGDRGTGTTIMVARNLFFDLDHGINLSQNTATIFEHNTVANIHPDFLYTIGAQTQTVEDSVVNFFVAEDGNNPTYGDGAYLGFNIISNVPHIFSGPDTRKVGGNVVNDITTKIEFFHNLLDQIADPVIGPNHPGSLIGGAYGPNTAGAPGFVDPENKNYMLMANSPARGTAPGGLDYGYTIPEWAYVLGGPASHTLATSASFTIGGPGLVAYKWRLNGGAWSPRILIGAGGNFPRGATPTVRQATLNLSGLGNGPQSLDVLGQDMSGNWQDADPARTLEGLPQAAPTARTWTVYAGAQLLGDLDGDGVEALLELSLGMNPTTTDGRNGVAGLPTASRAGDGHLILLVQIPENPAATSGHGLTGVTYAIEASDDLISWTTIATKVSSAAWTGPAQVTIGTATAGLVPVTVRDVSAGDRRFLRLVTSFGP